MGENKKIETAESAGFCFGVTEAVNLVYDLIDKKVPAVTLGPIIHNPSMVSELLEKGVRSVETIDDVKPHETVVLRSHGVPKETISTLEARGIQYQDATCPFVKKIQRIVARESAVSGTVVMITGNQLHPEVISIASHCVSDYYTAEDVAEFEQNLQKINNSSAERLVIVSQTTFNIEKFEKCREVSQKSTKPVQIFDTICAATEVRQKEAVQLASKCDIMLVIGGRESSNTAKLQEICKQHVKTFLIESASELKKADFYSVKKVGITAGASTPARIIKEVQETMSEFVNDISGLDDDISFEEGLEQTLKNVVNGDRVTGLVTAVGRTEVQVEIGTKHAGYIPLSELTSDPDKAPDDIVKKGDELELVVIRVNDVEGTVMLSKRRLDAQKGYDTIVKAHETGEVLEGVVTDVVRGGVIVLTHDTRVFIPASQATASRNDALEDLLKQKVSFKIIEVNQSRRRAVGSIRVILKEEQKELEDKFWETAEVGTRYSGAVKSLTQYGAFVDLGGVDGMIHISELSWKRIKHPSEIVKVGDVVEVYIKELDHEKKRISLGYKKTEDNPWEILREKYPLGSIMKAKVVSMTPFGAFANILPGIDGLIHISQISTKHIEKPQDVLEIGQEVEVMLTEADFERKRISLSIRAIQEEQNRHDEELEAATRKSPIEEAAETTSVYEAGPPEAGQAVALEEVVAEETDVE